MTKKNKMINNLEWSEMCSESDLYARLLIINEIVVIPFDHDRHIKIFLRSDGDYDYCVWQDCIGYFWEHGSGDKCYEHGYSCTDSVIEKVLKDGTEISVTLSSFVEIDSGCYTGSALEVVSELLKEYKK